MSGFYQNCAKDLIEDSLVNNVALLSLFLNLCENNKIGKVTVFLESELNVEVTMA